MKDFFIRVAAIPLLMPVFAIAIAAIFYYGKIFMDFFHIIVYGP